MKRESSRPTLSQIAEILAERRGRQNDFAFIQEMKVLVHLWRQRILVESLNSRPEDRPHFVVTFDMELEEVPISDFPGFPSDCTIMRTKECVPKPIRANGTLFDFIGYLDKKTRIPLAKSFESLEMLLHSKFTGKLARSVYINNRIYVAKYPAPAISISMVPEDMNEVPLVPCESSSTGCYDEKESPYPISGDIAQRIIQAILSTELASEVPTTAKEIPIANEQR